MAQVKCRNDHRFTFNGQGDVYCPTCNTFCGKVASNSIMAGPHSSISNVNTQQFNGVYQNSSGSGGRSKTVRCPDCRMLNYDDAETCYICGHDLPV